MHDIAPILDLINGYAAKGIMLPRTEFEMSEAIRDFTVVMRGERAARLRRAAFLQPDHRRDPLAGRRRAAPRPTEWAAGWWKHWCDEAQEYELDAVFAFTYVTEFFQKVGFHVVERGVLPLKAWKDCLRCPKFQACDEIAVLRILRPEHWRRTGGSRPRGPRTTSLSRSLRHATM